MLFKDWLDEADTWGILDKGTLDALSYNPRRAPVTKRSVLEQNKIAKRLGQDLDPDAAKLNEQAISGPSTPAIANPSFAQEKTFSSVLDALDKGYTSETDMAALLLKRGHEHIRAIGTRKMHSLLANSPDVVRSIDGADWARLKADNRFNLRVKNQLDEKGYGIYELGKNWDEGVQQQGPFNRGVYIMPKPLVDMFEKSDRAFGDVDWLRKFGEGFDEFHGLWKGYALVSPGYHARNGMSNLFQNYMANVGVPDGADATMAIGGAVEKAKQAFNLVRGVNHTGLASAGITAERASRAAATARKLGIKNEAGELMDATSIVREAMEQGVMGHGQFGYDLNFDEVQHLLSTMDLRSPRQLVRDLVKGKPNTGARNLDQVEDIALRTTLEGDTGHHPIQAIQEIFGKDGAVLGWNRLVGTQMENNSRLAHYIDRRAKGLSPSDSAISVKKWLFDYGELSKFEREIMKRMVPFYTWMRKNIPLQMAAIFENPARYARVPKFINGIEALSPGWSDITESDYEAEAHAMRLPLSQDGQPLNWTLDFPFQAFNDIDPNNPAKLVNNLNPLFKLAGEFAWGKSSFTGHPLERYEGEIPREGLFREAGLSRIFEHGATSLAPPIGKVNRWYKAVKRGEGGFQLLRELGMGIRPIDLGKNTYYKILNESSSLRDFERKINDEAARAAEQGSL
jgi:hypothetical protein